MTTSSTLESWQLAALSHEPRNRRLDLAICPAERAEVLRVRGRQARDDGEGLVVGTRLILVLLAGGEHVGASGGLAPHRTHAVDFAQLRLTHELWLLHGKRLTSFHPTEVRLDFADALEVLLRLGDVCGQLVELPLLADHLSVSHAFVPRLNLLDALQVLL